MVKLDLELTRQGYCWILLNSTPVILCCYGASQNRQNVYLYKIFVTMSGEQIRSRSINPQMESLIAYTEESKFANKPVLK